MEDGEPSLELLPELQELTYSGIRDTYDMFIYFHRWIRFPSERRSPCIFSPSKLKPKPFGVSAIASASSEAGNDIDT